MKAQRIADTQLLDGIPALQLLEGLGRLYQLIFVTDHRGQILWMSKELGALCGEAEFHIGREARSLFSRLSKPHQVFTIRSELRKCGYLTNMRVELNGCNGRPKPVELSILPISTTVDETPLLIAIARPIEERGRPAEEDRPGGLLAEILNAAPDAILAVDECGFVNYANRAVERLLGYPPEQLVRRPLALLLANILDVELVVSTLAPGEKVCDRELELRRSDGSSVRASVAVRALGAPGGREEGAVLLLRASSQDRASADLVHRNGELEHCVQTLAHDLRSPLVALLGFSRLLRQDYVARLDETGSRFLDRIEQAGRTMEALIHDVLELSRIGRSGERRSLVDPGSVLAQLQAEFKPRLDAKKIRLTLPERPPLVYCDRTRLYQLLSNLIGNAIDHMGPCENPSIQVEVADESSEHHISVRDSGRGIPPEHHEKIFEVFQSMGPHSDGRRGTGIGLAIVKKIAETHGGRAWVESDLGRGAAFYVSLPRN